MSVLDFGCGAMYWTLPAAEVAGNTVWAIEHYRLNQQISENGFDEFVTVAGGVVHLDKIERHVNRKKYAGIRFEDFERRDIWNFRKQ